MTAKILGFRSTGPHTAVPHPDELTRLRELPLSDLIDTILREAPSADMWTIVQGVRRVLTGLLTPDTWDEPGQADVQRMVSTSLDSMIAHGIIVRVPRPLGVLDGHAIAVAFGNAEDPPDYYTLARVTQSGSDDRVP